MTIIELCPNKYMVLRGSDKSTDGVCLTIICIELWDIMGLLFIFGILGWPESAIIGIFYINLL